ncbi:aldehyde dehydrogenase family protein [Geodermatophilus sp. SYSU D00708]
MTAGALAGSRPAAVGDEDARPTDPATLEPLGHVPATTAAELDDQGRRAQAALTGGWATDSRLRAEVLHGWAQQLLAHTDELVAALVAETGKPVTEARVELRASVDALLYNSGLTRYVGGRAGTLPDGNVAHLVREPVGVTAFIVPWNWPVLLLLRDLAPALAAGVTALVKPALQTTLVTRRVLELGRAAGVPDDVLHLVVGDGRAGSEAIRHPLVRAVAFTGSTPVGTQIMRTAAEGMKRPLLELGGKGASVVFADADVDAAVSASVAAAVITAGQMCMACTRILVERPRYEEVLERVVDGVRALRVGAPAEEATQVGPLISPAAGERVAAQLAAVEGAARIAAGGERVQVGGLAGWFQAPTVVTDVAPDSPLVQQDLFAPVVTVEPFDDERGAVRLANATHYGLTAGVWTSDVARAWRVARGLEFGTVWVNGWNKSYPEMPSGGFKSSGMGRTRGVEGVEQFTELKHVHFTVPGLPGPDGG